MTNKSEQHAERDPEGPILEQDHHLRGLTTHSLYIDSTRPSESTIWLIKNEDITTK